MTVRPRPASAFGYQPADDGATPMASLRRGLYRFVVIMAISETRERWPAVYRGEFGGFQGGEPPLGAREIRRSDVSRTTSVRVSFN